MNVMASMPVHISDLVVPLAHEATAMRTTDTAGSSPVRSGAVSTLSDRRGDVDSTIRSTPRIPATPGLRTSTTATRTTTTRTTSFGRARSANQSDGAFSFEDLLVAYRCCRERKRNTPTAQLFEFDLEANLWRLYHDLVDGTYKPGRSICFVVKHPKPREVWAADFRDRVVHHLLYNRIGDCFERAFIADSCACIRGRGTLYAAKRLDAKIRSITENWSRPAHYLKCDVANFFVSVDKRVLWEQLAARIPEPDWLWLTATILFHDPRTDFEQHSGPVDMALVPAHKSLLTQPDHLGLPIGNLSSQFFANVYLNALDQHVKHDLRARHYIRYVDDFILLHESKDWLSAAHADITAWLPRNLHIALNPTKTIVQPIQRGVDFVGQVIKPWCRTARPRTVRKALVRLRAMPKAEVFESANSYFGFLRQAPQSHSDRAALARLLRRMGWSIDRQFTKTFRRDLH